MPKKDQIPLTRHFEEMSTKTYEQYRYYCDRCQESTVGKKRTKTEDFVEHFQEILEEVEIIFRLCARCQRWVCRENCWDPIACTCEDCANLMVPEEEKQTPKSSSQTVYSSILGGICQHCQMILPEGVVDCPDCGQKVN